MPDPSEGLSVSDNRQTQLNAEQARQALRRLLDTTNPDPMDVVALDRIINPRKYGRDMDIFGFGGLGSMLGFSHTEMRMVNNSSEEGVLHQRSFTIWLEKLDGNQEYQQIEAKLDEMRQTAQKDPNYKLSGNPEFDQLYQRRQDIQDGLKIIAQHQAERELGITCLLYTSDAADERSSVDLGGRRIIKKKKTHSLGVERVNLTSRTRECA